jgi:large subunit ribosomal protein L3
MMRGLSAQPGAPRNAAGRRILFPAAPSSLFCFGETIVAIEFLCRKIGMSRVFTESGDCIPVTVLDASPNTVVLKRTAERDGYSALQLGSGSRREKTLSKAEVGHFKKAGVAVQRVLSESRVAADLAGQHEVGAQLKVDLFKAGQRVDVIGTSKGRGTQGVVKRHHFHIKKWTHGSHEGSRRPGSIGQRSYPGRVHKNKRMYGHMGDERVTTRNLLVVRVDADRNLLLVRGAVPGHNNAVVKVRGAVRA